MSDDAIYVIHVVNAQEDAANIRYIGRGAAARATQRISPATSRSPRATRKWLLRQVPINDSIALIPPILLNCWYIFCDWCADESWGCKRSKYYGADLDKRSDLYRCVPSIVVWTLECLFAICTCNHLELNWWTQIWWGDCFRSAHWYLSRLHTWRTNKPSSSNEEPFPDDTQDY